MYQVYTIRSPPPLFPSVMTLYLSVRAILHRELFPGKLIKFQSAWKQSYNSAIETRVYHKTKLNSIDKLYTHFVCTLCIWRESLSLLWLSRVKGLPKELSQDLCDFWLGHWHWQCFSFSLLITTMGESRQSAIGCNRKNMLTHSPQKPQSTTPLSPFSTLSLPLLLLFLFYLRMQLSTWFAIVLCQAKYESQFVWQIPSAICQSN